MSGALTLRLATPADAAPVAELFIASFGLLTFLPRLHTPEEDRAFVRDVLLPTHRVTLAERDGRLAGFMAEKHVWIGHFYMAPALRRSGVGSALMADAKARNGCLELWCFEENEAARAFYERHGFVAVERTDGAGNAEKRPDLRYRWSR
jgi:GNAT superfamily N-acetyltransferase